MGPNTTTDSNAFTINVDHSNGKTQGLDGLKNWSSSPNVTLSGGLPTTTSSGGVTFSTSNGGALWNYTFTVSKTDNNEGWIEFTTQLLAGAHLFPGNSLQVKGAGTVGFAKPAAAPGSPDLVLTKTALTAVSRGQTLTYTLSYRNQASGSNSATGVQLTDVLPPEVTYIAGSCTPTCTYDPLSRSLSWSLGTIAAGSALAMKTYQVTVGSGLPNNTSFTNDARIYSAENDANLNDNVSSVTTTVYIASISGAVLNDSNGNGVVDSGDNGLAGATVKLFVDANGNGFYDAGIDTQVGSAITTDSSGEWSFVALTSNKTYFVFRTNPSGYASTQAIPGSDTNATTTKVNNDQLKVVLSSNPDSHSVNNLFLAQPPFAIISGTVYNDTDGSGTVTAGDTGLAGVTVTLSGTSSNSTTTAANGTYSFTVTAGLYNLDYTLPVGYANTGANKPISNISVAWGATISGEDFFARRTTLTSIALTTGANPSAYGNSLTFTATVTSAAGNPAGIGTVTFMDGATTLCSAVALSGNTATCTTSSLSAGVSHSITAEYSGTTSAPGYSGSTSAPLAQTVNKATLIVTADDKSRVYGDTNPAFTYIITGFKNGETLATSGVTGTPDLTTSATPASSVAGNPYTITATIGTLAANNYTFNFVNGQLTITKAALTVTASGAALSNYAVTYVPGAFSITKANASVTPNAAGKIYGSADPAFTGSLSGFLPADGVSASYSRTAGQTVGGSPYTISATLSPASVLGNYNITYNTAPFTITPKAASVTPNPAGKAYGTADPPLTGTLSGFLASDGVAASYSRTPGEAIGSYTISATLSPAAVLGNYTITYNTATFTINKATLTITANNGTKMYGTVYTCITTYPSPDFNVSGLRPGDTVSSITLTTAGAAYNANVGAYPIVPSGAVGTGLGNYNITYVNGTLTVTARDGTVAYIGQTLFITSGSSSTTAQVMLSASVGDEDAAGLGSVGAATITFTDLLSGKILASREPVSVVPNSNDKTGTANTIVTLSTGQYGSQEYLIEVKLTGNYKNDQQTNAPPDSDPYRAAHPTVVIAIPASKNSLQAGGPVNKLATATGLYGQGTLTGFSAGMNYNNKGTNVQGQIMLTIEQPDGTYYIKSNSITSVAFSNLVGGVNTGVTIYTKASIFRINNDGSQTSIDGAVTLRMDAHDGGTTGDTVAFTVLSSKDSSLYYSNNWNYDSSILGWRTVAEAVNSPAFVAIN